MNKHLLLAALASSALISGYVWAAPERDDRYVADHYDDRLDDGRRSGSSLSPQFTFTNRE